MTEDNLRQREIRARADTETTITASHLCPLIMRDNEVIGQQKLSKAAQMIAEDELRESENNKKQALAIMKQWIEKNPQLINCRTDDNFILRFLRIRKFNVPLAQHNLIKYLNFRQSLSHLIFNLDYKESNVLELLNSGYIFASPVRDSSGRRVIIALSVQTCDTLFGQVRKQNRLSGGPELMVKNYAVIREYVSLPLDKLDPQKYSRIEMAKAHAITYETLLEDEETQVMGVTHFADMKGMVISHISFWAPYELAVVLRIGEQALPMRHKAIHLINFPPAFRYVFEFAVSRVSEKIKDRVRVYDSLSDLHKGLDSRCLPKEYGGTIPLADMINMWKEELSRSRYRLMGLDKMKSLVPIKRRNIDPLEGSFKKLEID